MKCFYLATALALAAAQPAAAQDISEPVWMTVQHNVDDLEAWRRVFDSGLQIRRDAGELQFWIATTPGPPISVLAIFQWDGAEAALAFVNDPLVRGAMLSAGVISEPVISPHETDPRKWITSEDAGTLQSEIAESD